MDHYPFYKPGDAPAANCPPRMNVNVRHGATISLLRRCEIAAGARMPKRKQAEDIVRDFKWKCCFRERIFVFFSPAFGWLFVKFLLKCLVKYRTG